MINILISVCIGILAGFFAEKLIKGSGFGLFLNLIVGILGSVLGGWIFGLLGIVSHNILGTLIMSIVGAVVLLWLLSFFFKKSA